MTTRVTVNLPDELADWLKDQAQENLRPISNQIAILLLQAWDRALKEKP